MVVEIQYPGRIPLHSLQMVLNFCQFIILDKKKDWWCCIAHH